MAEDGGQGILFMDASALALKSAERLKTVTGFETSDLASTGGVWDDLTAPQFP